MFRSSLYSSLVVSFLTTPLMLVRAEDKTSSEVFGNLGDFAVNRDEVLRRYAYSAVGESWREPPNSAPAVFPFCYMRIEDAKLGLDFDAKGTPLRKRSPFGQNEVWDQCLQHDGKFKIKAGTIRADKVYLSKPQAIELDRLQQIQRVSQGAPRDLQLRWVFDSVVGKDHGPGE